MKKITIKKVASPDDLTPEIKLILNQIDKRLFDDSPLAMKEGSYWWLAYCGKEVVGFAGLTYYPQLSSAFLSRVGVLPEYRGLGLQRRFIKARERQSVKDGYFRIVSYTSYDNVASANNLIKCGYRLYIPKFYWGVRNALYLLRELDR
jgi:GNAT superfamily N-acetyltransferase